MLVAHAAIEPALRRLVARGLEMDGAEPLLGGLLGRGGVRECRPHRTAAKAAASDDLSMVASLLFLIGTRRRSAQF
jgi:hypothetical protein